MGRKWGRKWKRNRSDGEKILLAKLIKFEISEVKIGLKEKSDSGIIVR